MTLILRRLISKLEYFKKKKKKNSCKTLVNVSEATCPTRFIMRRWRKKIVPGL